MRAGRSDPGRTTKAHNSTTGVGAIQSGKTIGHDLLGKKVRDPSAVAEHQAVGHIQSGRHRTNNHGMVKGRGKISTNLTNPLRGALLSGRNLGTGVFGHGPMKHAERTHLGKKIGGTKR